MTMLDRMRRHKAWLKWSLALVVLAFILLYIPDFLRDPAAGANMNDVVASVDGREVTVARFRRAYNQQMQAYRQAYGAQMDERLLRQLGIDQRIVQSMIEEEAALAEADRLGITASDEEVRERILSLPAFQEDGRFIGDARYRQLLQTQMPPMRPGEFELQVRRSITVEKLQGALTDWIIVTDPEVEDAFRRRNEKVRLALVNFPADQFREGVQASDEEVAAHLDGNREAYRMPEKRRIRYAAIDLQAVRERTPVTPQDVQRYYDDNREQFSTPEQVRASHILFELDGKDEGEVRTRAEAVLAQAKSPKADFAQLAVKHTDEEVGRTRGGDLDFFGRGQMVPQFEEAAFNMAVGQISDLVQTQFGFHIIKVTEKREAVTRSLTEVHAQIEDQLKGDRAQAEAQRLADEVGPRLNNPNDFESVARPRGLTVGDSPFFGPDEPIAGIGMAPAVASRAFEMKQGEVSDAIRTAQGFAFITVLEQQDSYIPKVDEVSQRVRDDLLRDKARQAARQRATELAGPLKAGDFNAAAKSAGLQVQTTELIARGAPIGDVGPHPAVDAAAFALPSGGVSEPITTDAGAVIVKVLEREDPNQDEFATGRQALREELVNERKNQFYAAYMNKAREGMRIDVNRAVLSQVLGS
ncbi:MAG: peptidylprolyl isomerase [Acidobacteria bacterium]|nr:peptidylprolyl isomerase [Acidobacteriota bacterium]